MLLHYVKVALRNLIKFKTQTILSIAGLAIGFACFALSVTWIRYEMSFDTFHPNGDRIYSLIETQNNAMDKAFLSRPLAKHFQNTFPEVEVATFVEYGRLWVEGYDKFLFFLETDSAFQKMFPYPFEKNLYVQPTSAGSFPMIVSKEKMRELADSSKQTIGAVYDQRQIVGTMKEFPINSRFHCDAICAVVPPTLSPNGKTSSRSFSYAPNYLDLFLQLKEGTDVKAFEKKISTVEYEGVKHHYILVPLSELRFKYPDPEASLKFAHIVIFACAGVLLILCALFNYITLFITRIHMRGREMALRKVNGSSNKQLVSLFSTEYILLLLFSLFVGEIIIELCMPKFVTLSGILLTRGAIYGETLAYALLLIVLSYLVGIIPISYFRRKTLQANIQPQSGPIRHLFRKTTLILQLIISIGLIFATMVLFKQVYYMTHEGTGFDSKNVWNVNVPVRDFNVADYAEKIAQIPTVTEVSKQVSSIFPYDGFGQITMTSTNEKGEKTTRCYHAMQVNEEFFRFFKFTFLIGEPFKEGEKNAVVINESLLKEQENETLETIMGKNILYGKVVGVIKNFYSGSQAEEQKPIVLYSPDYNDHAGMLLYRVMDGKAKETNEAIRTLLEKETGNTDFQFSSLEESLEKAYRSERALLLMLGIITGVCILISIFGIYSMVSLTCQQRRKEIAVRKVFGASVAQILHSFFREYALLLGIAALIAFPVAYYLMRLWLEQYVRQTSIDAWIYLVILALVALIILLTIGSRVWKAASANPAEVVKSE
ncbi:MAG: ABC transporter permease [Bacteroidales bacterium]|nr:ABC transporter permease [Bacteroidales bacterium]